MTDKVYEREKNLLQIKAKLAKESKSLLLVDSEPNIDVLKGVSMPEVVIPANDVKELRQRLLHLQGENNGLKDEIKKIKEEKNWQIESYEQEINTLNRKSKDSEKDLEALYLKLDEYEKEVKNLNKEIEEKNKEILDKNKEILGKNKEIQVKNNEIKEKTQEFEKLSKNINKARALQETAESFGTKKQEIPKEKTVALDQKFGLFKPKQQKENLNRQKFTSTLKNNPKKQLKLLAKQNEQKREKTPSPPKINNYFNGIAELHENYTNKIQSSLEKEKNYGENIIAVNKFFRFLTNSCVFPLIRLYSLLKNIEINGNIDEDLKVIYDKTKNFPSEFSPFKQELTEILNNETFSRLELLSLLRSFENSLFSFINSDNPGVFIAESTAFTTKQKENIVEGLENMQIFKKLESENKGLKEILSAIPKNPTRGDFELLERKLEFIERSYKQKEWEISMTLESVKNPLKFNNENQTLKMELINIKNQFEKERKEFEDTLKRKNKEIEAIKEELADLLSELECLRP